MLDNQQHPPIDLELIKTWVQEAALLVQRSSSKTTGWSSKSDGTPTTAVDREIETFLLDRINTYYPGHGILAEESGGCPSEHEFLWAIDPLDGTRAFVSGLPTWGISVGVVRQSEPFAGVFAMPAVGDLLWGDRSSAFYNGQALATYPVAGSSASMAFLAVPSNAHLHYNISYGRVRSVGSTAAHLAYLVRGSAIGVLTRRIYLWDIAGMLPILRHVGIELRYLSGLPLDVTGLLHGEIAPEPLLAAHPAVMHGLRESIQLK